MKLLRTYNCRAQGGYVRWIEIPYANITLDLWDTEKLNTCPPFMEYTPEYVVPIGLNPFKSETV